MKTGVVELLTYLKKSGKKIALASSTGSSTVIRKLEDAKIRDYFDAVVCGDMIENSKPTPDIFLKACQELGVQAERAFAIEDSYNGIRAAHKGGLRGIMVPDLLPSNEEMEEKAEMILGNLLDHPIKEDNVLFVKCCANLKEVGKSLLHHCGNIFPFFNLAQSIFGGCFKLTVKTLLGNTVF